MGFSKPKRTLDPDTQLEIRLVGHSNFLAQRLDIAAACAELRDLAGGREDLIAKALGHHLGGFVGAPGGGGSYHLLGAGLLAPMRFDLDEFAGRFEQTRRNASRPSHKNPD